MSLETEIRSLTKAVETLTGLLQSQLAGTVQLPLPGIEPATVTVSATAPAPEVTLPAAVAHAATVVAVQMPALPTFTTPPAAVAPAVPFNDAASLVAYTMAKYNQLGQDKGAQIQTILNQFGLANLSDLKPEHYAAYHALVEAIQ